MNWSIEYRRKIGCIMTVGIGNVMAETKEDAEMIFRKERSKTDRAADYEILKVYPEE